VKTINLRLKFTEKDWKRLKTIFGIKPDKKFPAGDIRYMKHIFRFTIEKFMRKPEDIVPGFRKKEKLPKFRPRRQMQITKPSK